MYLKASTDFHKLAQASETTLQRLGFEYIRNWADHLVEFEINTPAYFRIVIETRKDPEVHNLILPSISPAKGCLVDIRYGLGSEGGELDVASFAAAKFLRTLVASLDQKPWDGLRLHESGKEKKKWKKALG